MALNLGDAFLTFRGDLTELNLAFDQAAQSAEKLAPAQAQVDALGAGFDRVATDAEQAAAAMKGAGETGAQAGSQIQTAWQAVAKATIENYQAQQELSKAMYAVKSTAGDSAEAVSRLALAQERAATTSAQLTEARAAATAETTQAIVATDELTLAQKAAGQSSLLMGTEMTEAGEKAAFSMETAKGTMALAGEEMGVKLPRHLRTFVAELPGVGAAMEAAFSGVALFVLAQLIVEATNKLTEFISETFIYTEENKKAYEAQVELNKAIKDQADKLASLKKAYDDMGLTGSDKTALAIRRLNDEWVKNEQAIRNARNILYEYRQEQSEDPSFGLKTITEGMVDKATKDLALALAAQRAFQQEFTNLAKQGNQELLAEQSAHNEAVINADKTVGEARIALLQAQSRLRLAMVTNSYYEQGQAQARFDEQSYRLEVGSLDRERAAIVADMAKRKELGESDPESPNKLLETNARIEALQKQHHAKLINDSVDFYQKIQALQKQAQPQDAKIPDTAIELSDAGKAIQQLQDGLTALGIQGSATWTAQKIDAIAAYDKIRATGLATYTDLRQALLKVRQAELSEALALGNTSAADKYKKEIADITKELTKLGIITDATANKTKHFGDRFGGVTGRLNQFQQDLQASRGEMTKTEADFEMVTTSATQAVGTAVTAWVSGEESLGQALKQSIAQEAAAIAGKAAMYALYWTAMGIADSFWHPARSAADFAAAETFAATALIAGGIAYAMHGSASGSSSGASSTGSGVAVAPGDAAPTTNPTPVTNIQRFATGGLVSTPTLALIGDSISSASHAASEGILPLEDPRAMRRIAGAITDQMGGGGGGTVNHFHIEGMISDDKLDNVIRKINRRVQNNGVKLTASKALTVTKRA